MATYLAPNPNPPSVPFNSSQFSPLINQNTINYVNNTFLPYSGGIITGALTGTNCTFSGQAAIGTTINGYPLTLGTTNQTITSYTYLSSGSANPGTGSNTGSQSFSLYTNGRIACAAEIDIFSDFKIKENIRDITEDEANLFIKVNPKYYNKKGFTNKELGYISQDIAKTKLLGLINIVHCEDQPEYIDEDIISPKDRVLTINYQKIICLLHKKIQMQENIINKHNIILEKFYSL